MKKAISLLLCIVMVIGVFCSTPMTVFAVETSPLSFYSNIDKTGWAVAFSDNSFEGDVVIPATHEDLPVLAIADYAFSECLYITSISIPSTVVSIGDRAFDGCNSLKDVNVDESNEHFTSIDGVLYNKAVTEIIVLPAGFTGSYVMPETVESINFDVFGSLQLSAITINSKIEEINIWGLKYSKTIKDVNVSPENPAYSSEDGILFNKDKTTLLYCPFGKTGDYTVPESVTIIAQDAFYCSSLTSISVGANVKKILDSAFSFSAISSITLEEGIEYIGNNVFRCCINLADVKIPSGVKYLGAAFNECYYLKNVEIGDNIGEIRFGLFEDVEGLETLTLGNNYENVSESTFSGLGGVKSLYIKDVESWIPINLSSDADIFWMAENIYIDGKDISEITEFVISKETDFSKNSCILSRFTSLKEFKLSEDAPYINYAVRDGVLYDDSVTNIIKYPTGKIGEYVVPESVRTISTCAFAGVIGLTEIKIPDEVIFLNEYMFKDCVNLQNVTLPSGTTEIPRGAFYNCINLKSIDLGVSLEKVNVAAFYNTGLEEIDFPDTLIGIYDNAFLDCKNLKTVRMGKNLEFVIDGAFRGCTIENCYISNEVVTGRSVLGVKASNIYFEYGVKEIEDKAFKSNYEIKKLHFSDSVEKIGESAFNNCINLQTVDFGAGLLEVGAEAFYNCKALNKVNLKNLHFWCNVRFSDEYSNPLYYAGALYLNDTLVEELEIPKGVIAIGDYAFYNCKSIKKFIIPSSVKSIGVFVFYDVELEEVHLPSVEEWCETTIKNGSFSLTQDVTKVFMDGKMITDLVIPENVTKIPNFAFKGWWFLESVTLNNITEIGSGAFSICVKLEEINIPATTKKIGADAFWGCTSLKSVNIENGLEMIDAYAFFCCEALEKIVVPDSVKTIESWAFSECIGLKEVIFGDGIEFVSEHTFENCISLESVTLGKNVKGMNSCFDGCTSLKELKAPDLKMWCELALDFYPLSAVEKFYVNDELIEGELIIPDGVTKISSCVFGGYPLITGVKMSGSVTEIEENAFYMCENLENVTIGSGIKTLSGYIFLGCEKLSEIVLSEGVERIEGPVFAAHEKVKKIVLPKSLKYISSQAFSQRFEEKEVYYNSNLIDWMSIEIGDGKDPLFSGAQFYLDGELLEELVIPEQFNEIPACIFSGAVSIKSVTMHDGIEKIGDFAFANCSGLEDITLGKSTTEIGNNAFYSCSSLKEIDLPETVSSIGDYAFASCGKLTSFKIPRAVERIGDATFSGCTMLEDINLHSNIKSIGNGAFSNCKSLVEIEIPKSVTSINSDTFLNCKGLESIRLPDTLIKIGGRAFIGCIALNSIFIPKSVTSIGEMIFTASNLDYVYGEPESLASSIAKQYKAQYIDSTTLFVAVGENKQQGINVITDDMMLTKASDLIKFEGYAFTAEVLESSGTKCLGTGSVIGIYDTTGCLVSEVVVVVKGDLNGDGVCDALDCMLAELTRTSCITLGESYMLAGDYTEDNEIDLDDFQQIANKAVNREVA